jgi:hypothetical protein
VDNSWQIIHLTATLPIHLQDAWETLLGINKTRTIFIRGPTNRPELAYNVFHVNPKERHLDSVAKVLIRMLEDDDPTAEGRHIMFVASISECNNLASSFGCFKHHGDMGKKDRDEQLAGWNKGIDPETGCQETWMVATPGLITGYDYHRVDTVIFYEIGYGLLNLVQGGGRGGRSGLKANVIVLTSDCKHIHRKGLSVAEDVELLELMGEWTHRVDVCRRWIISKTMDGLPVTCGDLPGAERCDICEPGSMLKRIFEKAKDSAAKPTGAIMPMEDIQSLVGSSRKEVTTQRIDDEDLDDMDFEEDELIAQLDLSTLPFEGPSTSSITQTEPKDVGKRNMVVMKKSQVKPMSAMAIAGVEDVGMNVKVAGSINKQMQEKKQQKSKILNDLGTTLRGHCVICWTWKGIFVKTGPGIKHQPVSDCGKQRHCDGKLPWGGGPKLFGSQVDFMKNHFCWHCGLPQDVNHVHYRPSCHGVPGKEKCGFVGLTTDILFTLHQDLELWWMVKREFGLGDELDDIKKFGAWCEGYKENTLNYWMGLEVVIWYWIKGSKVNR